MSVEFKYYTKGFVRDGENRLSMFEEEDNDKVYAKSNGRKFFVKTVDGYLVNPYTGQYSRRKVYTWRSVTPEVFNLYAKFLKSGKNTDSSTAERNL